MKVTIVILSVMVAVLSLFVFKYKEQANEYKMVAQTAYSTAAKYASDCTTDEVTPQDNETDIDAEPVN